MTPPAVLESAHRAVSADTLQRHLEWFSRVRRDTGDAGENQAAEYVAAELRAAGVPVTLHEFDAFLSYPTRILNPVIYSQAGRFQHDPAEWSPIMRATTSQTLSALGRAAALPKLAGQHEHGFLRTQVVRERNRVVTALREATRLVEETLAAT